MFKKVEKGEIKMNKYSQYVKTEEIKEARKSKGITVSDIIDKMGLSSRVSYYNIENGVVEPRISQMIMISQLLGEPIDYFFNI